MSIDRYVLVDRNNQEGYEYDDYTRAIDEAGTDHAVVARTYTYSDSELVWTPNGQMRWPPDEDEEEEDDGDDEA